MGACRKLYCSQHILIRSLEEWKTQLDKNKIVRVVLIDLSKAFDCISHYLLIAKLDACDFENEALSLISSYLKNRKQSVRINKVYSIFVVLISGVLQGSVLGVFFLNDLCLFITKASLHNYTDDNTLSAYSSDLNSLIDILLEESQTTTNWLKVNRMIANPKKFRAMLVSKRKKHRTGRFYNFYH